MIHKHNAHVCADYGLRVPRGTRIATGTGGTLAGIGGTACALHFTHAPIVFPYRLAVALVAAGAIGLAGALSLALSNTVGPRFQRRALVSAARLQGDETALDLGAGTGFITVALAQALPGGTVHAIDIWSQSALPAPSPDIARRNAEIEGVADRVQIENGHSSAIPYPANTFDIVTDYRVLQSARRRVARAHTVREIARVLKPGGRAVICESLRVIRPVPALVKVEGLRVREQRLCFTALPPLGIVIIEKPLAG
jgi:SAM-dependent methyltransferase